jgi:hypothetical protein
VSGRPGRARPRIRERRAYGDRASEMVEAAVRPDLALTLRTDENHRSGRTNRTAASTRRSASRWDAERAPMLLREAKQLRHSENCDVLARTRNKTRRSTSALARPRASGRPALRFIEATVAGSDTALLLPPNLERPAAGVCTIAFDSGAASRRAIALATFRSPWVRPRRRSMDPRPAGTRTGSAYAIGRFGQLRRAPRFSVRTWLGVALLARVVDCP